MKQQISYTVQEEAQYCEPQEWVKKSKCPSQLRVSLPEQGLGGNSNRIQKTYYAEETEIKVHRV